MGITLKKLVEKLRYQKNVSGKVFLGFDGFVDEVIHVVDKRLDKERYQRIQTIEEYGERIRRSAGLSTNIELVTVKQKLGGNGPILANSLAELGMSVTYAGTLGEREIHPVFRAMQKKCQMITLGEPAHTDAVEFLDGKLICSKLKELNQVSWENILEKIGWQNLLSLLQDSRVIGFENWTMLLQMNDIWKHMIEEVLPFLPQTREKRILFIDLADPEKRSKEELWEALNLLEQFRCKFRVILGLNQKEACEIAELYGCQIQNYQEEDIGKLSTILYAKLDVDTLVIHSVRQACAFWENEFARVDGPYCPVPKITTGAGDHFNAGFVLGQCLNFSLEESLFLGTFNSGFYVREGRSPNLDELTLFLAQWADSKENN